MGRDSQSPFRFANRSQDEVPRVDSDAYLDRLKPFGDPPLIEEGQQLPHHDGGPYRIFGVSGKQGHDSIADVLIDKAVVLSDHGANPAEHGIEEFEVLGWGHRF